MFTSVLSTGMGARVQASLVELKQTAGRAPLAAGAAPAL